MTNYSAPKIAAPVGTCDTHMHFYNAKYPTAPTALSTPPDFWLDDYRKVQECLGLQRVVVVQPTTYGRDNSCQLEAMKAFGVNARGVMVVDETTTDAELERLTELGVRGARFHMLPGGAVPWDILEDVAAHVHEFGWHIQLQLNGRELVDHDEVLFRLPGTLVVDHLGRFTPPIEVSEGDASFRVLLRLLDRGKCWVKMSAPYESSKSGAPDFTDCLPEAKALVKAAPHRMVWATNCPHPGQKNPLSPAATLDLLLDWVEDEETRNRILVDNPAELYGF